MSGDVLTQRRKSAEIGVVTQARLGDVCRIDTSISFPCEEEIWLLNLDMIEQQTGRVIQRIYVDRNALGGSTVAFDENCVLYSKLRPNLNKVVLPDRKGVATSEILPLRCDADHATREFVCWFLRSPTFVSYAMNRTAGAKMPRLGTKELLNAKIPLPPLADQRRIATKLDRLCDIVTKRKQQLVQLQQLVKSRFVEMFGDVLSHTEQFETVKVANVADVGSSKRIFQNEYVSQGIPFYRTKEIVELSHGKPITTELYISHERYAEIKERYGTPKKGDLLISAVGTIGEIWIVDGKDEFYFKDGNLMQIRPGEQLDSIYLRQCLNVLIRHFKRMIPSGTAYAALTIDSVKKMVIPLPPLALQREFAAFVAKVDKLAFAVRKSLESAEKLYRQQLSETFS